MNRLDEHEQKKAAVVILLNMTLLFSTASAVIGGPWGPDLQSRFSIEFTYALYLLIQVASMIVVNKIWRFKP